MQEEFRETQTDRETDWLTEKQRERQTKRQIPGPDLKSLDNPNVSFGTGRWYLTAVIYHYSFSTHHIDPPEVKITNHQLKNLTLVCNSDGIPIPLLEWMHNGLPLSNNMDSFTITYMYGRSSNSSVLQWVNALTKEMFTCVATNNLGSRNDSVTVMI